MQQPMNTDANSLNQAGTRAERNYTMSVKSIRTFAAIAALAAASLSVGCGSSSKAADADAAKNVEPVVVTAVEATATKVADYIEANGEFVARESSAVSPQVEGLVAATLVEMGGFVNEGAPLIQLDRTNAELSLQDARATEKQGEAALAQAEARLGVSNTQDLSTNPDAAAARANFEAAEANLNLAQSEEKRSRSLRETGDVSQSSYDRALAQLRSAEAQRNAAKQQYQAALDIAKQSAGGVTSARAVLEAARVRVKMAEKNLRDTTVRAPFTGYVSDRPVSVGEYVTTSTVLAVVEKVQPLRLRLRVPETRASVVKTGQKVIARIQAYPDKSFEGEVTAVNPAVESASRSFIAEAIFPNAERILRPGMFTTARLETGSERELVSVPSTSAKADSATDTIVVWVVERDHARMRTVQLTRRDGDRAYIAEGVKPGEKVLAGNTTMLYDGAPIRISGAPAKGAE